MRAIVELEIASTSLKDLLVAPDRVAKAGAGFKVPIF
jgi:hypothetical protein